MAALFAVQTVLPAVRNLMQQIRPGMTQERRQATERQIVRLKDQLADLIVRLKNAGFTDLERKYQWPTLGCRLEKAGRDNDRKLVQTLAGQLQATMRTLTLKEIMDKPDREQNSNMRHRILFENLYSACTAAYAFDDSDFADRIMDPALAQYRQIMGTHRDYNLDMYAARLRLDHIIGTRIPLTGRTFANRPLLLDSLRGKVVFLYLSDAPWFKEDRRTAEQYLRDALEKLYREIPHSRLEIIAVSQAEKPEDAAIVPWIQAFDSQTDLKGVPLSQYYSWQDNHPLNSNYLVGPDGRVAASSLNIREARQKIIELCDKLEQAEKIAQQEKEKETRTIRYYQTNKRHKGCCLFHKRKAVYFRFCQ